MGLFRAASDGTVTWVNAAASTLLAVGDRWHVDLVLDPPVTGPAITGTPRHQVTRIEHGVLGVYSLVLSPAAGGGVSGTLVEATELAQLQDALARRESDLRAASGERRLARDELRRQEHLLAAVVASTTDVVVIMSPEGDLEFLNSAGRETLGIRRTGDVDHLHASALFGAAGWATLRTSAVPLTTAEGSWSGDAEIRRRSGEVIPVSLVMVAHRDATDRVDRLSVVARDASGHKAVERRLVREAHTDQLTELPNRARFNELLGEALTSGTERASPVGLLFCDLDRFKQVNDRLGHAAGDRLLRVVAERISGVLRDGDVAARVGGDEFLVLAYDVDDPAALLHLAQRVRAALDDPVRIDDDGGPVTLSFSIGVAVSTPEDSAAQLIDRADQAMYRAKHHGKNRVEMVYPTEQRRPAVAVAHDALREAIEGNQLRLVYQPIVALSSRRVIGAEALVRWNHPERGLISPSAFLDVAEQTGLVHPLGSWVLAHSIEQAAMWAADATLPNLRLHVNLSASQLLQGDLAERATAILAAFELPAHTLWVEVDEDAFDDRLVRTQLATFRDRGIRVALDNFGHGGSSLAELRRHRVDALKLSSVLVAGLVDDTADGAIVSTIQTLADALDLQTVAEGIERTAQVTALRALGVGHGQGFLFAQGLDGETFADHVRAHHDGSAAPGPTDPEVDLRRHDAEHATARIDHAAS